MKIGKRIIKTSIAVFLSLAVFLLLYALNYAIGLRQSPNELSTDPVYWYAPTNFYTPFFASIGAVYAMHRNVAQSREQAKLRSVGSVVGGYYGFFVIALVEWLFLDALNMEKGSFLYSFFLYFIVALGIVGLIALTVRLKISYVAFISCLTYLSVTVSIRNGGMNAFLFATNRIVSTVIGVLIALFVNTFPQYLIKNRNILFASSLDNAMLNSKHVLSPFMEYKLNALTGERCRFTFMTTRAMTSLAGIFQNVRLVNPIVVMTGCAIYDPVTKEYDSVVCVRPDLRTEAEALFEKHGVRPLSYLINENVLQCYYEKLDSEGAKLYYETRRKHASYSFVQAKVPPQLSVAQYVIVEKNEVVDALIQEFQTLSTAEEFNVIHYPFERLAGYSFLKINYKNAQKVTALEKLKGDCDFVVCFGSGRTDLEAMRRADFSFCLSSAHDYVKEVADYVIPSDEPDEIVKQMAKIFHARNYRKYLEGLKRRAEQEKEGR